MTADTPSRRPGVLVALLSVALAIAAVALVVSCPCPVEAARPSPWWMAILIAVGYGVAERFVFSVEMRNDGITFSLSEVPTAFAIVFLNPVLAVAIRVAVSLAIMVRVQRLAIHKVAFNAVLFVFETALAFSIARAIAAPDASTDTRLVVAVGIAVAATTLAGAAIVSIAIACFERGFVERMVGELRTSLVVGTTSASVAAVTLTPALVDLRLALVPLLPIVATWWVLLQFGRLSQRHRDLQDLQGFSDVVGRSLQMTELVPAALDETMRLLRADHGAIVVFGDDGEPVAVHRSDGWTGELPDGAHDAPWCGMPAAGFLPGRTGGGASPTMAIPVADGRGRLGMLLLAGRRSVTGAIDPTELARADQLAAQLAIGLRNALLHADMEHAALHDSLTGNPNRPAFDQLVAGALRHPSMTGVAAVLMLDLDRFKEVNDTLGHHMGDAVLVEFAARVRAELHPDDVLARFGGDEFAVFVRRDDRGAVTDLAKRVLSQSYAPIALGGSAVVVTASVGIAFADEGDAAATSLVRRADIAMYVAKRQHAGYEVYREDLDRRTPQRLSMLGDLREALDARQLEVHYQPKVDLATSTVCGAEALVRWHHPVRGWVNPIDFVHVAEETGLIRQLTDQVLAVAIATARTWLDAGFDLDIAVNLSTLDLLDELLPERVAGHLAAAGLAPDRLTLEITESSLMADTPRAMTTIERLDELGVGLALDDFGTGYSSLTYLRQLPVNELKIDRSFVGSMLSNSNDEVIVRSTVELGHHLGLRVVAEGIEDEPTADHVRAIGCDLGQGYGISRPLTATAFTAWLVARRTGDRTDRAGAPAMA